MQTLEHANGFDGSDPTTLREPEPKPAKPAKLRLVRPNKKAAAAVTSPELPPPVRPVLLESQEYIREVERQKREVEGEINLLDATEAQRDENLRSWIEMLQGTRDGEHKAQMVRRADLMRIYDGCTASLEASRAAHGIGQTAE